jgi:hypothetical protein
MKRKFKVRGMPYLSLPVRILLIILLSVPAASFAVVYAAPPAAATSCWYGGVDCVFAPGYCQNGSYIPSGEVAFLWYNGYLQADTFLVYGPYCRTIWTLLDYLSDDWHRYYAWTNRQTGPPGDTSFDAAAVGGPNPFIVSEQLYDAGWVGTTWGTYTPGSDIFENPQVGDVYNNTDPPF